VVVRYGLHRDRVETVLPGLGVSPSGRRHDQVEDLHDLGTQRPGEQPLTAQRVLGSYAALLVRGGAQRQIGVGGE